MTSLRHRYVFFATISIVFVLFATYYMRGVPGGFPSPSTILDEVNEKPPPPPPDAGSDGPITVPEPPKEEEKKFKYKPTSNAIAPPIVENFPLAQNAHSAAELPPLPSWVAPPDPHVPEKTPLFIGFTRNWRLLQQVVVGYITSGWPAEDIYVVENTGVMDSNLRGLLTLQNPFFLNHTRLEILGVNVLITPTLFTFAQLQNFYLFTSIEKKWEHYFWSHMDVITIPFEDKYKENHPDLLPPDHPKHDYTDFKTPYGFCVDALREAMTPDKDTGKVKPWANRFFSYDRLALVNVEAYTSIGGWDTMIPFYMTDCDMHARIEMAGLSIEDKPAGLIYDVASSLDDLLVLYRKRGDGIPIADFKDPNFIDDELRQIEEAEKKAKDAGLKDPEPKKEEKMRKREEEVERATNTSAVPADDMEEMSRKEFAAAPGFKTGLTPDPGSRRWIEDEISSSNFEHLTVILDRMQNSKAASSKGRNTWQARQRGGEGEPFYRDSAGFEQAIQMTIEHGRTVFREKWGHRDCDIVKVGLRPKDAWRVEHDW